MRLFKKQEKVPTFYEKEIDRLQTLLASQQPGTNEYKETMNELAKLHEFVGKENDIILKNQKLSQQGRDNVVSKVIGFLGLGGLAFGLAKFEKSGHFFSGSSGNVISGIVKIGTRFFG